MFNYQTIQRWMSVRLDTICVSFGVVTAALALALRNSDFISKDILIFSLTLVTDVIIMFSITIRFAVELSSLLVSSQRIIEYTKLDEEDLLVKPADEQLEKIAWPQKGEIRFEDVSMLYRDGLDPSLRDLSCKMDSGYKVGIVGRTGAGKSTIL